MSDVVVVGAGVAGCIAARALSADHEVRVLDRSGVAAGATGLSAGLVAPTLFYADMPGAARHANAFFREFDGTGQFSFTERRRLDFVESGDEADARAKAERLSADDFPVRYLDAEAVQSTYPRFTPDGFVGAVEYDDTGWVDPYTYANALYEDARERGVEFELDVEVEGVLAEAGDVVGVETGDGVRDADRVVVAAGWATPGLVADHVELPVKAYRTQCVVLEPEEAIDETFPLGRVGSEHLYFRPEHNGDLLIGGSHEVVADPAKVSRDADEEFTMQVAETIPRLVTGFENAGYVNGWAGVDAATPDARPILDEPDAAPDGLVIATGFNGLGVMASPLAAAAVREICGGESAPFPLDPFRLDRFESASGGFDLYTTSEM